MPTIQVSPVTYQKMGEVPTLRGHKNFTMKANTVINSSHPGREILKATTDGLEHFRKENCYQKYEKREILLLLINDTLNGASSSGDANDSFVCKRGNISRSGIIVFSAL